MGNIGFDDRGEYIDEGFFPISWHRNEFEAPTLSGKSDRREPFGPNRCWPIAIGASHFPREIFVEISRISLAQPLPSCFARVEMNNLVRDFLKFHNGFG